MYQVTNTINKEIENIKTIEEDREHIQSEVDHFNY